MTVQLKQALTSVLIRALTLIDYPAEHFSPFRAYAPRADVVLAPNLE